MGVTYNQNKRKLNSTKEILFMIPVPYYFNTFGKGEEKKQFETLLVVKS